MTDSFDEQAGHKYFAASCFNGTWDLLDQESRTDVAHHLAGRMCLVPFGEQVDKRVGIATSHGHPLCKPHFVSIPSLVMKRQLAESSDAANCCWMFDMPATSNSPGDPAAIALGDFVGSPSSALTSSIGDATNMW